MAAERFGAVEDDEDDDDDGLGSLAPAADDEFKADDLFGMGAGSELRLKGEGMPGNGGAPAAAVR